MTLNGHAQSVKDALGSVEVGDNALRNGNRSGRNSNRLRVETEIDNQFFRRTGNAAEIGVAGYSFVVVDLNLRSGCGFSGFGSGVFCGHLNYLSFYITIKNVKLFEINNRDLVSTNLFYLTHIASKTFQLS